VLAAALAVGACGDDDSGGGGAASDSDKPVTLKVGVLPIGDLAPLYLGMDKRFFKDENLTIEPAVAEGGGKKVSVNTLKNLPEVAVRNSLEKAGVDPSTVEFVEIPFPDVPAALPSHRAALA
jgi:ABC-type nitrate/sulfonate/bicarbonate transport system substrate-binding protein